MIRSQDVVGLDDLPWWAVYVLGVLMGIPIGWWMTW